jgi:DNA-binding NtrC family response regulator
MKETIPVVNPEGPLIPLPDAGVPEPVLILTPTGRDASLAAAYLHEARIRTHICRDVEELCAAFDGAAAGLVAEEALPEAALDRLLPTLQRQPLWSDVPLILLTTSPPTTEALWQRVQALGSAVGQVTLLERPLHWVTLLSTVRAALRSRRRQHDVRQLHEELQRRIAEQTALLGQLHASE